VKLTSDSFSSLGTSTWLTPVRFFFKLSKLQPGLLAAATVTIILLGLVEGIALTLLIPMLGFIGLGTGKDEVLSGPAKLLVEMFNFLDLPITLVSVLSVFFCVGISQTLLHGLQQYLISLSGERLTYNARRFIFDLATKAEWEFFVSIKSGQLNNIIVSETNRVGIIYGNTITALGLISLFCVYVVFAIWMSWQFTLGVCIVGLVSTIVMNRLFAASKRFGIYTSKASNQMQEILGDYLAASKSIRLMNANSAVSEKFREAVRSVGDYIRSNQMNLIIIKAMSEPLALVFIVSVLYLSVTNSLLPGAELLIFLGIFYRLAPRIVQLQQLIQRIIAVLPAYESISHILSSLEKAKEREGGEMFQGLKISIKIKNLNVSVGKFKILNNISLEIPANKTTILTGQSGSGKSTLVDTIFGLRKPDIGNIWFDNLELNELDLNSLRNRIGYVSQGHHFFHDTIYNNLKIANPKASENDMWNSLRQAGAYEFVQKHPDKLNANMGTDGLRFSGGQRQRLALARALISNPDILILDEPSSALDLESTQDLIQVLTVLEKKMTIVLVTHQQLFELNADKIYLIKDGCIQCVKNC